MTKLLIFDFDGTIADTKSVYYHAISHELEVFGLSEKQIDKAIDLGMSMRKTLKSLGFNFFYSWFLRKRIMKKVEKHVSEVKKCRDADSIKLIKEKKIVVTNSLKEFAMPILKHLKLKKTFLEVYGADDFSDKAEFIKEYIKKNKIDRKECYYIGDRVADVKLAKKVGCLSVVISGKCAWDSRKELIEASPDFIIDDLADLVGIA